MADRFWVGGTASWDATAGTKWATTSGGAGGASVPTSADDVYFDANSGTVTVTMSVSTGNCKNLNFTGFTGTINGSSNIVCVGSLTLSSSMTWALSTTLFMRAPASAGTQTITSNGKSITAIVEIGSASIQPTIELADAFVSTNLLNIVGGTFNTNNYNVTASSLLGK